MGLNCNAEEHLLDISKDRLKSVNIIHPCTRVHNGLAGTCSSYDAVCAHLLGLSLKPLTVTFACPVYLASKWNVIDGSAKGAMTLLFNASCNVCGQEPIGDFQN